MMRIQFTIVPLPMTAGEKFNEATYFYGQMVASVNNTRTFPFNLSAFLSALRSTTFYLQAQYAHEAQFSDWYGRAEIMKQDPVLKMLNGLRTQAIHQRPINLAVYSGPKLHENPTTSSRLQITHIPDADGNITWRYRLGLDAEERIAQAITDWEFENNGESVLATCQHGLIELDKLLRSWHDAFDKEIGVVVHFDSCRFLLPRFQQSDDFLDAPLMIGDPSLYRWCRPECHVLPLKVVDHHENGDLRRVVLNLLTEAVRQPSEPAHVHPHGKVGALHIGSADMVRVGVARDSVGLTAYAGCRTVTTLAFGIDFTVNLHQLGKVDILTERSLDCFAVELQSVARQLHAMRKTAREVFHEVTRCNGITLADHPARDQLRIGVDGRPRPNITANAVLLDLLRCCVLLFTPDELPDFIDLNPFAMKIDHRFVQEVRARRS
jgi:hypothetical protein